MKYKYCRTCAESLVTYHRHQFGAVGRRGHGRPGQAVNLSCADHVTPESAGSINLPAFTVATNLVPSAEEATADQSTAGSVPRRPTLADAVGKISGGNHLIGILHDHPSSHAHTGDFIHISGNGRQRQRKYHRRDVVGGDKTHVGLDLIAGYRIRHPEERAGHIGQPVAAPVKSAAVTLFEKLALVLYSATLADNRASGSVPR